MAKEENLYRTLGVSTAATQDEIKKAFRTNAQKYHPDMVSVSSFPQRNQPQALLG
jgi:DnaJ-class molecular chaperone